jgi:recombination protein RecR
MTTLPEPVIALMAALGKLPGIGPRSAERIALHLVQTELDTVKQIAQALVESREKISVCQTCGALTETQPCSICASPKRDASVVCVVESPVDVIRIEKSSAFQGKYHVLGGRISPLNGVGPEELRITELETRLTQEPIREIVIAIGSDVEGDATSYYLGKRLASSDVKVTRIAQGMPAGSGLEYADELTLSRALQGRREMN